jgi:GNAT superfamily N-acetyltransferase
MLGGSVSEPHLCVAEGGTLEQILDETFPTWGDGLSRDAYARFNMAQMKTRWGAQHLQRLALVDGGRLLCTAKRYRFDGWLNGRRVGVLGLGAIFTPAKLRRRGLARTLIERMLDEAREQGLELALLFSEIGTRYYERLGFHPIRTPDALLTVATRPGAPAMLVRSGEERDYPEIAAMHAVRAERYAFALDRSVDFVGYAVTKKRLAAGLGPAGRRVVQFFAAEEGGRAVAYLMMTVSGGSRGNGGVGRRPPGQPEYWTIEDWGDRDPSGARLGAMLQVLLARAPGERRPTIVSWRPADFRPPQVSAITEVASSSVMMMRWTGRQIDPLPLDPGRLLYWRGDAF